MSVTGPQTFEMHSWGVENSSATGRLPSTWLNDTECMLSAGTPGGQQRRVAVDARLGVGGDRRRALADVGDRRGLRDRDLAGRADQAVRRLGQRQHRVGPGVRQRESGPRRSPGSRRDRRSACCGTGALRPSGPRAPGTGPGPGSWGSWPRRSPWARRRTRRCSCSPRTRRGRVPGVNVPVAPPNWAEDLTSAPSWVSERPCADGKSPAGGCSAPRRGWRPRSCAALALARFAAAAWELVDVVFDVVELTAREDPQPAIASATVRAATRARGCSEVMSLMMSDTAHPFASGAMPP